MLINTCLFRAFCYVRRLLLRTAEAHRDAIDPLAARDGRSYRYYFPFFTFFMSLRLAGSVEKVVWDKIPTPPRFVHETNDPIIYFLIEKTMTANRENEYLKERTLRCSAVGNPKPS